MAHPYLSLGMLFLLALGLVNVVAVLAHVAYINRISHRITRQDGQIELVLEILFRMENK